MKTNCPTWLAEVSAGEPDDAHSVDDAREICRACPVLVACRKWCLAQDVAGFAAGLTREQRLKYQADNGITPPVVTVLDVLPARDITPRVTDELPVLASGKLHSRVVDLIKRLTLEGFEAQNISDRLSHPHVTAETVDYVRRTYMQGYARVQQGVKQ